jgi:hypothetical protein
LHARQPAGHRLQRRSPPHQLPRPDPRVAVLLQQ